VRGGTARSGHPRPARPRRWCRRGARTAALSLTLAASPAGIAVHFSAGLTALTVFDAVLACPSVAVPARPPRLEPARRRVASRPALPVPAVADWPTAASHDAINPRPRCWEVVPAASAACLFPARRR
jgi:hypothetical protein